MQTWSDWDKQDLKAIKLKEAKDDECISCPKCNGQWLEEVKLQRFVADHNVILGQNVPPRPGGMGYTILRCAVCGNLLEPRVIHAVRDLGGDDYSHMLNTLEGKYDKRPKETQVEKTSNEISTKEL
jgi:hypothetical protein